MGAASKVVLLALAAFGVVGATKGYEAYQKKKKKTEVPKAALSGVWAENATVGAQPGITSDVLLPIDLSTKPDVRNASSGDVVTANTTTVGSETMLHSLVIDLTPEAALQAYEILLHLVANKGIDMTNAVMRDKAVKDVLIVLAPKVDWSKGLTPYAYGTPPVDVWVGVKLLAELAHQTYWNKQAAKG
jgi:hypothetical protein